MSSSVVGRSQNVECSHRQHTAVRRPQILWLILGRGSALRTVCARNLCRFNVSDARWQLELLMSECEYGTAKSRRLGAISQTRRMLLVGDSAQLPPFSRLNAPPDSPDAAVSLIERVHKTVGSAMLQTQ